MGSGGRQEGLGQARTVNGDGLAWLQGREGSAAKHADNRWAGILRNWRVSGLAAVRAGFPYSAYENSAN